MKLTYKVLLALCLIISEYSFAEDSFMRWLERMERAVRGLNYEALMVFNENGEFSSIKIFHRAEDKNRFEQVKLVSHNGMKQEVVLHDGEITVVLPQNGRDRVLRNPLADTFLSLAKSLKRYNVTREGEEIVAGRNAVVFNIRAKDNDRYSYKLWLDKETGIYLRAVWLENNQVSYDAMIVKLKFMSAMPPLIHDRLKHRHKQAADLVTPAPPGTQGVKIGWLPEGFQFSRKYHYPQDGPATTEHIVFSDGTLRVSVYVEDKNAGEILKNRIKVGRTNGFTVDIVDKQVTVLAEMPLPTVKRIADSISVKLEPAGN